MIILPLVGGEMTLSLAFLPSLRLPPALPSLPTALACPWRKGYSQNGRSPFSIACPAPTVCLTLPEAMPLFSLLIDSVIYTNILGSGSFTALVGWAACSSCPVLLPPPYSFPTPLHTQSWDYPTPPATPIQFCLTCPCGSALYLTRLPPQLILPT